jgi:hypothetical protein
MGASLIAVALLSACSDDDSAAPTTAPNSSSSPAPTSGASSTESPTTTRASTTTAASTTTTTTSTTSPPTTAAPTTTIDPRQAAAEYYLQSVTPSNCYLQITQLIESEVYGKDGTLTRKEWPAAQEKLLPAIKGLADGELTFLSALVNYDWPDDVQPDIDNLVNELSATANWHGQLASAGSFDAFVGSPPAPQGSAATVVRAKLGLPSNVNSTVEECANLNLPTG